MNWKSLLTPREVEVVRCLLEGLTHYQIADRLGLSPDGAKHCLFKFWVRFGVSTRAELLQLISGPDDQEQAGVAVRKPRGPKLNSGAAAAPLDEQPETDKADDLRILPRVTHRQRGNFRYQGSA
jgi:hypothetical protein